MVKTALRWLAVASLALAVVIGAAPTVHGQGSCPKGTEVSSGQTVCSPYLSAAQPEGATAKCKDGYWSFALTHDGECSGHGGVDYFVTAAQSSPTTAQAAGTAAANPAVAAAATPPAVAKTGLNHTQQLVDLALLCLGLGCALVLASRPGVVR